MKLQCQFHIWKWCLYIIFNLFNNILISGQSHVVWIAKLFDITERNTKVKVYFKTKIKFSIQNLLIADCTWKMEHDRLFNSSIYIFGNKLIRRKIRVIETFNSIEWLISIKAFMQLCLVKEAVYHIISHIKHCLCCLAKPNKLSNQSCAIQNIKKEVIIDSCFSYRLCGGRLRHYLLE